VNIQDTGIFNKRIVAFDFHGTLVERHQHHKPYRIEKSKAVHVNRPVLEILKRCLKLGIKTYIISAENITGVGEEGIDNNERILHHYGIEIPKSDIYCTDYAAKNTWYEDLKIEFLVDDEIGNVLLARQMGIKGLLVDYKDHPVASMFTRMTLGGKVLNGEF
jgi:FMN phosphatase YigB (HAD superfamily)